MIGHPFSSPSPNLKDPANINITPLSEIQQQVVMLIATGKSAREIAHKSGLSEATVLRWKQQPEIISAVSDILSSNPDAFQERLNRLAIKAVEVLEATLDDPSVSSSEKIYAAVKVLEISGMTKPHQHEKSIPESCPYNLTEVPAESHATPHRLEKVLAEL